MRLQIITQFVSYLTYLAFLYASILNNLLLFIKVTTPSFLFKPLPQDFHLDGLPCHTSKSKKIMHIDSNIEGRLAAMCTSNKMQSGQDASRSFNTVCEDGESFLTLQIICQTLAIKRQSSNVYLETFLIKCAHNRVTRHESQP